MRCVPRFWQVLLSVACIFSTLEGFAAPPDDAGQQPAIPADVQAAFDQHLKPLLARYCVNCHRGDEAKAGVDLAAFATSEQALADAGTWQRVWSALRRGEMPPKAPFPEPEQRQQMIAAVAGLLEQAARVGGRAPGHVVMRRLNQVEYNNTVLDLFGAYRAPRYSGGTVYDPRQGMPPQVRIVEHRTVRETVVPLPPDDIGYGFTNIGEVLSLPPFLLEKYLAASHQVIEQLVEGGNDRRRRGRRGEDVGPTDTAAAMRQFVTNFSRRTLGRPITEEEMRREPDAAARRFLGAFGHRAFRRPMTEEEIARYHGLYKKAAQANQSFEAALKVPMQAMLVSPHFLFRVELGLAEANQDGLRPLADHELATRLSYFLWSSMPDEELLRLADAGRLRDPAVLEAQARRMLRHRYSKELGEQFGMQWLQINGILSAMPFPDLYPEFYDRKYLPVSFQTETMLLFDTILVEDRSVLEFIDPGYTWLNDTLIDFYQLDRAGVRSPGRAFWQRFDLPDKRRGGVLAMGSTMLATSLAERTSPVKRGQWVLETLLGAPQPPPPDNVEELDATAAVAENLSLRDRLERHRADAACAVCHRRMDPLGFGLENFNAIGKWRDTDGGKPLDTTGTLVDGSTFNGVVELKEMLVNQRRDEFLRCLTQKMMTYALGRKLEYSDDAAIESIVARLKQNEHRFSELVVGIVLSEPFRFIRVTDEPRYNAGLSP